MAERARDMRQWRDQTLERQAQQHQEWSLQGLRSLQHDAAEMRTNLSAVDAAVASLAEGMASVQRQLLFRADDASASAIVMCNEERMQAIARRICDIKLAITRVN